VNHGTYTKTEKQNSFPRHFLNNDIRLKKVKETEKGYFAFGFFEKPKT